MFNKKGLTISGHLIQWIPKFIYLVIAFLCVVFLIRFIVITNIDASEAEARILSNRIFFSPNIISYIDSETGRTFPGVIDFDKYSKMQNIGINEMDTKTITYGQENRLIAAKLALLDMETNSESTIFYNKNNYNFWEPRILSTVEGGSGS